MQKKAVDILMISDHESDFDLLQRELRKFKIMNRISFLKIDNADAESLNKSIAALINETSPVILIINISWPEVREMVTIQRLVQHQVAEKVRIIAMSESNDAYKYLENENYRFAGFINKPFNCNKFISEVSKIGNFWQLHSN